MISGTIGSNEDAKPAIRFNSKLTVTVPGEVIDLGNNTLGYRITVNTADFANNSVPVDGNVDVKVTVTSHDVAGNPAIATDTHIVH